MIQFHKCFYPQPAKAAKHIQVLVSKIKSQFEQISHLHCRKTSQSLLSHNPEIKNNENFEQDPTITIKSPNPQICHDRPLIKCTLQLQWKIEHSNRLKNKIPLNISQLLHNVNKQKRTK